MTPPRLPRGLYGITPDWPDTPRLLEAIRAAARGGLRTLQWRRKEGAITARREQARIVTHLCRELGLVCIINDHWQWLAEAKSDIVAHGVHLGRDDGDIAPVRRALGPHALIGVSCYNELARARAALADGADYVAFGALYPSPTKPQAVRAPLALLTQARALTDRYPAPRPAVVAIGGITPANAAPVVAAGADAIALISSLFAHAGSAAASQHAAQRCAALYAEPHPHRPSQPEPNTS